MEKYIEGTTANGNNDLSLILILITKYVC